MSKVRELLIDHWGLFRPHRPHLALSLIGGAKNFRMEGRKRETFKVGYSFVFIIQKDFYLNISLKDDRILLVWNLFN
jgi:hypothetical protein